MADNNTLLEKLEGLVARFEEVSTLITDPNVIADQKRYVKLTKEYKDMSDIMKARKEYIQCLNGLEEAKQIMTTESDPEMKEMAREEANACEVRIPNWKRKSNCCLFPPTRRTTVMPSSKYVAAREAMKQPSLPATCFACTVNTAKRKVGNWKSPVPTKVLPEDSRKLSVM